MPGLQPSGAYYNQIKEPQVEVLGGSNESVPDGGVGGGAASSFFCSGADEAFEFGQLNHPALTPSYFPIAFAGSQGTYQCSCVVDRCRTEGGCGTLVPDHKYLVVCLPQTASNCHSAGQPLVFDHLVWDTRDSIGADYLRIQTRNYIEDHGFLYSRYLIRMLSRDLGDASTHPCGDVHMGADMGITWSFPSWPDPGDPNSVPPYFLDVPYNRELLRYFTCAAIARSPIQYPQRVNSLSGGTGDAQELDGEAIAELYNLASVATNSIGNAIANGTYGNMYATTPTDEERMTKEIVGNVYAILQDMLLHIEMPTSGGEFSTPADVTRLMSCPVARGSLVEYQHDQNRICIRPEEAGRCDSKRHTGSDAHYNVGNSCTPSAGEHFDATHGLVETKWRFPGYDLWNDHNGFWIPSSASTDVSADSSMSPFLVSSIAHQWVHAYFCRTLGHCRVNLDPSSQESSWEETTGVITQALVFTSLCRAGYCANNFGMKQGELIRSLSWGSYFTGEYATEASIPMYYDVNGNRILGWCDSRMKMTV